MKESTAHILTSIVTMSLISCGAGFAGSKLREYRKEIPANTIYSDINNDGYKDVLINRKNSSPYILLGNKDGSYRMPEEKDGSLEQKAIDLFSNR